MQIQVYLFAPPILSQGAVLDLTPTAIARLIQNYDRVASKRAFAAWISGLSTFRRTQIAGIAFLEKRALEIAMRLGLPGAIRQAVACDFRLNVLRCGDDVFEVRSRLFRSLRDCG